jgi:hypothetical protein
MFYDEVIIDDELFYKTDPEGGWIRATNKQLTARLTKAEDDLGKIEELVRRYKSWVTTG